MAHELAALATIAGVYLMAVASPGPNFFMISQQSMAGQRAMAVRIALGVAIGSATWALLAMAGVAAVLANAGWAFAAIRLAGATYLIWFGIKLLRASRSPVPAMATPVLAASRALRTGVITSLTNPKSGAFWTSVFASLFPAHAPGWMFAATLATIAVMSAAWHVGIALVFASAGVQARYRPLRRRIDAVCGVFLVGLGARLAIAR